MQKITIPNYPMVTPTPIVLIGADVGGKPNFTTVGAFGFVCLGPIFYVSLKRTHHTTQGVRENNCFSVNIPSADLVAKVDYCGMKSGTDVDKSSLFSVFYGTLPAAPLIEECPMNFCCKVIQTTSVNDFDVYFGEIVESYASQSCFVDGKVSPERINPLFAIGPHYFEAGMQVGAVFQAGKQIK